MRYDGPRSAVKSIFDPFLFSNAVNFGLASVENAIAYWTGSKSSYFKPNIL